MLTSEISFLKSHKTYNADVGAPAAKAGFVQPGHSVSFGERPVLVEAAVEVVARL